MFKMFKSSVVLVILQFGFLNAFPYAIPIGNDLLQSGALLVSPQSSYICDGRCDGASLEDKTPSRETTKTSVLFTFPNQFNQTSQLEYKQEVQKEKNGEATKEVNEPIQPVYFQTYYINAAGQPVTDYHPITYEIPEEEETQTNTEEESNMALEVEPLSPVDVNVPKVEAEANRDLRLAAIDVLNGKESLTQAVENLLEKQGKCVDKEILGNVVEDIQLEKPRSQSLPVEIKVTELKPASVAEQVHQIHVMSDNHI